MNKEVWMKRSLFFFLKRPAHNCSLSSAGLQYQLFQTLALQHYPGKNKCLKKSSSTWLKKNRFILVVAGMMQCKKNLENYLQMVTCILFFGMFRCTTILCFCKCLILLKYLHCFRQDISGKRSMFNIFPIT